MKRIFYLLPMLALLATAQPSAARPHGPRPTFAELDADGNGSVTEVEFTAPLVEHAGERFEELDTDDSGTLTVEEMLAPKLAHASERFAAIDTDDDGVVSESEYAAARRGRGRRGGPPAE